MKIFSRASGFLAIFGALLTAFVMFYALNAAGARVSKPSDVTGLVLQLDANEECRGIADGTAVATWDDQSGNARHATQATGAQQPTCQTATDDLVNGKPVIDFTDDSMTFTTTGSMAAWTIFAVYKLDAVNAAAQYVVSGTLQGVYAGGSDGTIAGYGGWDGTNIREASEEPLTWGVVTYQQTALFRDGVEATYADTGTLGAFTLTTVGTRADATTLDFDGQIAEILVYNATLTAVQRRAVEGYLRAKWMGEKIPVPSFFVSGKLPAKQKQGNCTDSNVAAWLSMDEASGNLTVPTGCAASGTVLTAAGNPTYGNDTGVNSGLGTAITFDGTGDLFSTTTDVNAFDPGTSNMVVEGWVNIAAASGSNRGIVGKYDGGDGWMLWMNGDCCTLTWYFRESGGGLVCSVADGVLTSATWHHFRATWVNSTGVCTLSIDGRTAASGTNAAMIGSTTATATAMEVGARPDIGPFTGSIADLRITIGNATNDLKFNGPAYSGFAGSTLTAPTFTRATTSTRVNPVTGLVESVASGVPVVGAPLSGGDDGSIDGTEPTGVYVGSATTFLALNNEVLTAANWIDGAGTAVRAQNAATAPDGTLTADSIEDADASNNNIIVSNNATIPNDSTSTTGTVWVKCDSAHTLTVRVRVVGGSAVATDTAVSCTSVWQRVVSTVANNSTGNTIANILLFPADAAGAASLTGTAYFWRPQMYNKAFAVPLDPAVAGTAVTVNQDDLSYGTPYVDGEYTLVTWVNPTATGALTLSWGGTHWWQASQGTVPQLRDGALSYSKLGTTGPTANVWNHFAVSYSQTGDLVRHFLNGATNGSGTADSGNTANSTTLQLGQSTISSGAASFKSDFRVYQQVLSPQQIRALYLNKSTLYAARDLSPKERIRRHVMLATARPLDFLWGIFGERRRKADEVEAAKLWVNSDSFPEPAFVMPEGAQP